jgi:hypothetical protein
MNRWAGLAEFLASDDGAVMARLVTGIHNDTKFQHMFLECYVMPRRQMQRHFIREAIASGELKRGTDPELLIDPLNGSLFFRYLQRSFGEELCRRIFDRVILDLRR